MAESRKEQDLEMPLFIYFFKFRGRQRCSFWPEKRTLAKNISDLNLTPKMSLYLWFA